MTQYDLLVSEIRNNKMCTGPISDVCCLIFEKSIILRKNQTFSIFQVDAVFSVFLNDVYCVVNGV